MHGAPFISRKIMRAPSSPLTWQFVSFYDFVSFSFKLKSFQNNLIGALIMDSGLVIVTFITVVYIIIMFSLLFYVKYEWCDLLFKNNTVGILWTSLAFKTFFTC